MTIDVVDRMRFYVPVNILAADYSGVLKDHGVTMLAHTANNFLQMHQKPIPCRLRESTFSLDGLIEKSSVGEQILYLYRTAPLAFRLLDLLRKCSLARRHSNMSTSTFRYHAEIRKHSKAS